MMRKNYKNISVGLYQFNQELSDKSIINNNRIKVLMP